MTIKHCVCCGELFILRAQSPNQRYCSAPRCQQARKRKWQQEKLRSDPAYRENQRDAQRAWRNTHSEYWQRYRATHPDYTERNRARQRSKISEQTLIPGAQPIAKMDMSALTSGTYWIRVLREENASESRTWLVELTSVCLGCPCKKDACKERT